MGKSLFGSRLVPRITIETLHKQLELMIRKGEVVGYGKGYRLETTYADSAFLELEEDPVH